MLTINFYPDSDREVFEKAAREYEEIWQREGERIISSIYKNTGLNFFTKEINAIVYEGYSHSYPLRLRASHSKVLKTTTLIHELFHRIFLDNKIQFEGKIYTKEWDRNVHMTLSMLLYFTLKELYNGDVLKENIKKESIGDRARIWEEVLAIDDREKIKHIKSILASRQRI